MLILIVVRHSRTNIIFVCETILEISSMKEDFMFSFIEPPW